jgi:hypothetical protein
VGRDGQCACEVAFEAGQEARACREREREGCEQARYVLCRGTGKEAPGPRASSTAGGAGGGAARGAGRQGEVYGHGLRQMGEGVGGQSAILRHP